MLTAKNLFKSKKQNKQHLVSFMNNSHKLSKLKNRLRRLEKKLPDIGPDRKGPMAQRITELKALLKS